MLNKLNEGSQKLLISISAGILGTLLAFLSSLLTPMHPQVTFDFSHIATFGIAIAFGPIYGFLTGIIGSIYPYIEFGILGIYGPFAGLAIILGKAMTGYICGLLRNKIPPFLAVNISYIPESIYTLVFLQFMTMYLPAGTVTWDLTSSIFMEGWVEVILFSFIIETVMHRKIMELAVIMLEIFIIMFLVHKEFIYTLLILLLITLITLILFEIISPMIKKHKSQNSNIKDDPPD